jgi:hypothetical protein
VVIARDAQHPSNLLLVPQNELTIQASFAIESSSNLRARRFG